MNSTNQVIKCLLIYIFMSCMACHSRDKLVRIAKSPQDSINHIKPVPESYLEYDSVKINGVIPMQSNFGKVAAILGNPDSITTPNPRTEIAYYDRTPNYCYYKGLFFEKYKDTLIFRSIDFRKNSSLFFGTGKIRFDNKTTITDFKKCYPSVFEKNRLSGSDMDTRQSFFLNIDNKMTSDRWVFTFNNKDKLITIEYWLDD